MTEQAYAAIAAACDRLLRAPGTTLGRVAIPLLHVINEHPSCLAQYAPLLPSSSVTRSRPSPFTLLNSARVAARAGRAVTRLFRPPESLTRARALGQVDVLIISHLVSLSLLDTPDDFYFGALQSSLRERGVTSALVLLNHLHGEDARRAYTMRSFPATRMILPRTVLPRVEAQIWRQCAAARGYLRQAAHDAHDTVDQAVAKLASDHALSAGTAENLRLHACISDVCHLLNPRIIITTHEGDASERMIWHAARSTGRRPLCVGYQHARLFARAHAIRRSLGVPGIDCDPDVILTQGEIPHAALAASPGLGSIRLIAYGSHRRAEPMTLPALDERPRSCLVLPDGDDGECSILFEFALACARRAPEIAFALRPHPSVNLTALRSRHNALRQLPDNVTLSVSGTLDQECARARYCLYRGSSAVIQAVLAGIKPFYVARAGELPFDSLFALPYWRETLMSPEDFVTRVSATDASPDQDAARRAWAFCDRYVSRVRPAAIDELLDMVGAPVREPAQ
jgi:hypothetical protein